MMSPPQIQQAIRAALDQAKFAANIRSSRSLTGGCIHEVLLVTLDDGSEVVAKVNRASSAGLFHEEQQGLHALAETGTVLVPRPFGVAVAHDCAVLLMEAISPAQPRAEMWMRLGEELASLHRADSTASDGRYGFSLDNHLGTTPQPNSWSDDWIHFNAEHRLGHQLRLAQNAQLLDRDERALIDCVISRLDQLIPRTPTPALLHGDLWSGNALPACDRNGGLRIALIDPAPYIGDGWADIAMMQLFGGFPRSCFDRYSEIIGDHEDVALRIKVYQLYHVLNHINLFGRSYAGQAISLARQLQ